MSASTSTESSVRFEDGTATRLERWGERGPVVLCVHGIASSRRAWTRLGGRLGTSMRVFAYDQSGHGDRGSTSAPMTLERSLSDLGSVIAALPGPLDVLIGHSWGGAVAVLAGPTFRPRTGVIAIDPMLYVPPGTFEREYVDDLRAVLALEPDAKARAIRAMYAGAHPDDVAGKLHAMLPMTIGALERLGRENGVDSGDWDLRAAIRDYAQRLAIFVAGVESVLSAADLDVIRRSAGANVALRTFEGYGHNLHRDAFAAFAEAVEAFVRA